MFFPPGTFNVPPSQPSSDGSRDGQGAGDHNADYVFGDRQTVRAHGKFTEMQFARLMCLRSHVQDGDRIPESSVLEAPEKFGLVETLYVPKHAPACFDDDCSDCRAFMAGIELY